MAADELTAQPSDVLNAWPAFGNLPAGEQTSLLNAASQKILNFCGRPFIQAFHNELHDGKNNGRLWLLHRPVISVAAITINGIPVVNPEGDYPAWTFVSKTGELVRGPGFAPDRFAWWFPAGKQNVLVQYWAGFTAVPDPIVRATVWAVKWLSEQTKVSGIYSAERIGDYNYTLNQTAFSMTLPQHIAALCADYVQDDALI